MAKSKRKNRRLRRTVRRTVGALCMITAIIVAAIPFPDAQAGNPEPVPGANGLPYEYDNSLVDIKFDNQDVQNNIDKKFEDNIRTAYTISNVSNNWQLDWQFKYSSAKDGADGYITKYNNQYQVNEIKLKYRVFSDYLYIAQSNYEQFFTSPEEDVDITDSNGKNNDVDQSSVDLVKSVKSLGHEYILDGDKCMEGGSLDLSKSDAYDFYANSEDATIKKEYEDYRAAYEKYLTDQANPEAVAVKPDALKHTYKDIYPANAQMQFLCSQIFGKTIPLSLQFVDKRVYESGEESDATGWEKVYVPYLTEIPDHENTITSEEGHTYYFDENGFLANKFNTIRGIAKEAFKGVQNVVTLEMDDQISFIGNSAFEDSFVQSVALPMGTVIGNRAFKNCARLNTVVIPEGVQEIGTEAFYGTSLTDVTIPDSVKKIGPGVFANCGQLTDVQFDGHAAEKAIQDFAFYDCLKLNSVKFGESNITSMGKCAFAVSKVENGNLTDFTFPDNIVDANNIGDYLLGGRSNLAHVTMPKNLGTNVSSELPNTMFYGCNNLQDVNFLEKSVYVSYPETLFKDVVNPSFYVRGPKCVSTAGDEPADPRKSTWKATFNGGEHVPYVYSENGQDYYEVSNGDYVLVIDGDGMLVSCNFANGEKDIGELDSDGNILSSFKIPSNVGETPVAGIKDGCFGKPDLDTSVISHIKVLEVEDGSALHKIEDNVFQKAKILEYAYLGDSVQEIGASSFADCPELKRVDIGNNLTAIGNGAFKNSSQLEEISFENPSGGAASFPLANIGAEAFSTKGKQLTVYGLIESEYGPFEWAMQEGNFMDPSAGIRVCYKSPKDTAQGMTVILDNSNNLPTLVDYPTCKDTKVAAAIQKKLKNESLTPEEEALITNASNIMVPRGVKSVDVEGYFNSSSKLNGLKPEYTSNAATIATYFNDLKNKFGTEDGHKGLFNSDYTEGLGDYLESEQPEERKLYEKEVIGNDFIETVSLPDVVYLPDQCFYSCERLSTVDLGEKMEDAGKLPFLHADNVASVGCTSGNYNYNNGILYHNNEDGTKSLVECLPGRGNVVGTSTISLENDPDLANVTSIEPQAFKDCKNITGADFTDVSQFDEIPEECFSGDEMLTEVDLPMNVKLIGDRAFAGTGNYTKVIVRGHEVGLGKNVYGEIGGDDRVKQPFLVSYRDSAVRAAAKKQDVNVEETLDEMLTVKFYMPDAKTLIATEMVEIDGSARKVAPDETEMKEKGFLKDGERLKGWNGSEDINKITQNCFFIADIESEGGENPDKPVNPNDPNKPVNPNDPNKPVNPNDPNKPVNPNDPNKPVDPNKPDSKPDSGDNTAKRTLTVVYGNGSGSYAKGTTVIISAIDPPAGKEFYKWTTNNTGLTITSATSAATTVKMPDSDATVTATYRDKSSVSGNASKPTVSKKNNNSTEVQINKPGISNTDKAYASVNGSTDNFVVKITESSEAANAVATALSNEYANMEPIKYFAMDISLYDKSGNRVTDTNGLSVNVTMPIPDALVQYGGNNKVGAVVNGTTLEKLNCKFTTVNGIPCITFTASHFSPYTVYVDTSSLSANVLDTTPKTGDGIHPKWFLCIGLACLSIVLFMKKDKVTVSA